MIMKIQLLNLNNGVLIVSFFIKILFNTYLKQFAHLSYFIVSIFYLIYGAYYFISGSSSSEDKDEDNIEDYDVRFARYKERVKAEEHFFYTSEIESTSSSDSSQ